MLSLVDGGNQGSEEFVLLFALCRGTHWVLHFMGKSRVFLPAPQIYRQGSPDMFDQHMDQIPPVELVIRKPPTLPKSRINPTCEADTKALTIIMTSSSLVDLREKGKEWFVGVKLTCRGEFSMIMNAAQDTSQILATYFFHNRYWSMSTW